MTRHLAFAMATIGLSLLARSSAAADALAVPDRMQLTVSGGVGVPDGPFRQAGFTTLPPIYLGAELQVRLHRIFGLGVVAGGNSFMGSLLGANARAEARATNHLFVSGGVGPLFVPSGNLAGAILVQGDLTLSLRFVTNGALMIGPTLAVAAHEGGRDHCGIDTCDAWLGTGARLLTLRAGFGVAF